MPSFLVVGGKFELIAPLVLKAAYTSILSPHTLKASCTRKFKLFIAPLVLY